MKTKLHYVFSLGLILIGFSVLGQQNYFTKIENANRINQVKLDSNTLPIKFETYSINLDGFRNELLNAPQRGGNNVNTDLILEFPNLEGKLERYQIFEASVMHPDLQAKYPEIRSYAGYGIDTKANYLRFSISPYKGISGIILSSETNQTIVIYPLTGDTTKMILFNRSDKSKKKDSFVCSTIDEIQDQVLNTENRVLSADATLHTFDLALSVTGEYTAYHGGTKVLANVAMANTMARVNGVFERDFNVTMVLIANNDLVVYTDGLTDPYSDPSIGAAVPGGTWGTELQANLTSVITESGYDIGHLFGDSGGGGNAGCIGCICVDGSKGSAYTSPSDGIPEGDTFDIDYVAHEIGHQFGGNHTFTHQSESPSSTISQMEPGSGSTIMGYAGITGSTDVQSNSDPYFHAISIQQITAHVASRTCDDETAITNNVPVANAGSDLTLPVGTPFILTGSATDGDGGDVLAYCWEQFDENNGLGGGFPDETSTNSDLPLFRSYNPTSSPTRTFPELQSLLDNGVNGNTWEKVPMAPRTADFRFTVRDNKPGGAANDFDDMVVNWDIAYGPFAVTSQNTPNSIVWTQLTSETITWDVLNTDGLAGAANVNILLSTDGGITFTETLAANTPNDGTELITVPNVEAPYCRVKIEPVGNQFFAINTAAFAIGNYTYGGGETCTDYVFNAGIAVPEDAGSYAGYGLTVPDSGTITDVDINVDITHVDNSDLFYAWRHPSELAGVHELASGICTGAADVDLTFDDEGTTVNCSSTNNGDNVLPQVSLSSFSDGLDSLGDWVFFITDVNVGDGNTATWNTVTLTICVGGIEPVLAVNDLVADNLFSIYPNPNNGEFSIQVNSSSSNNILVEVYDLRGRLILNKSYNNSGNLNEKLNLGNVQSGIYLVNVNDGSRKSTKKIVVN